MSPRLTTEKCKRTNKSSKWGFYVLSSVPYFTRDSYAGSGVAPSLGLCCTINGVGSSTGAGTLGYSRAVAYTYACPGNGEKCTGTIKVECQKVGTFTRAHISLKKTGRSCHSVFHGPITRGTKRTPLRVFVCSGSAFGVRRVTTAGHAVLPPGQPP